MGIVPPTRQEKIAFYAAHLSPWGLHATDIGTSVAAVGNLTSLVEAAQAAFLAANEARDASKAATQAYYAAVASMGKSGGDIISAIRTYASTTNNLAVFDLAALPRPAEDTPIPAPGTPRDYLLLLNTSGALTLKWKCTNPEGANGTVYEITRRLSPTGDFAYVGVAGGDKTYTDETLPAGSSGVAYRVTGLRSGLRGPTSECVVNFGVGGGGGFALANAPEEGIPQEIVNASMAA